MPSPRYADLSAWKNKLKAQVKARGAKTWQEFYARRDFLRKDQKLPTHEAWIQAFREVMGEDPPDFDIIPKGQYDEKTQLPKDPERKKGRPPKKKVIPSGLNDPEDFLEEETDTAASVKWVFKNLAVAVEKKDCPNAACWELLHWARSNKDAFYNGMLGRFAPSRTEITKEAREKVDADGLIDTINDLLEVNETCEVCCREFTHFMGEPIFRCPDCRQKIRNLDDEARKQALAEFRALVGDDSGSDE